MKTKHIIQLLYGIATFVPGINHLRAIRAKGTGGTNSARYCYSVWLRHLVMAEINGLNTSPKTVAELGPGDSIGIGLAALISGSEKYYAFDVVEYANIKTNLTIFDELVTLFKNKAPIPGDDEWPKVNPKLEDYSFPTYILDESRLNKALAPSRIERIRNSVKRVGIEKSVVEYKVPWHGVNVLTPESVDMIYSQAVLEHVDDLKKTYSAMNSWLKPTGHMSHTIDFKCHRYADEWNGHWTHSDVIWKLMRGRRPYWINRIPCSVHMKLIADAGFMLRTIKTTTAESNLLLKHLAPRFRSISQSDLTTSGAYIQAVKKYVTEI